MRVKDHLKSDAELELFYTIVDNFCQHQLSPYVNDIEREGKVPRDFWYKLGALGLNGITVAKEYGGLGLGLKYHVVALAVISAYSASVGLSYAAHSNLCIHQLAKYGTSSQKQKYLPDLISGKKIGCLAISEVDAGSDALGLKLKASKQGDNFIINGNKMWITNAPSADIVIAYAKTDNDITAFVLERSSGWNSSQIIDKMGMRGSETSEIVFTNCKATSEDVLGGINQGKYILMDGLSTERLVLAGGPIGIMQACLTEMHQYMNIRQQFGKKIAGFQLMQAKFADCYNKFAATLNWALAITSSEINRHDPTALLLFASENATYVANEAIQTLGGNGYSEDFNVARYFRDAKLYEIGAGTNEIRRTLVGRYLLNDS